MRSSRFPVRAGLVALLLTLGACAPAADDASSGSPADRAADAPAAAVGGENTVEARRAAIPRTAPGTDGMIRLLAALAATVDPEANFYASEERVQWLKTQPRPDEPSERFSFDMRMARDLLQSGRSREALELYERITSILSRSDAPANREALMRLHKLRALAWMRMGEQDNCLQRHGIDSCLLPITGEGVHADQRGSRAAIDEYVKALQADPQDLTTIWLLNIAVMTVGQYPGGLPEPWRIPPQVFESDYDIQRFEDVAGGAGVDVLGLAGGVVMEDLDGDGFLDVLVSEWSHRGTMRFFHNNGDGTFDDRTARAGLTGLTGGLNMIHADYDNDGDRDVLVLRGAYLGREGHIPNSLLRNDGGGRFTDVTEAAGLLDFHPTQTADWADYDGDGWLDLFIGNESIDESAAGNLYVVAGPGIEDLNPCRLFRNNGDGTFTDVAPGLGLDVIGIVKGVTWGDVDNDGRPDLYLSRMTQPNLLFHNDGPGADGGWSFSNVTVTAGVSEPVYSFPTWFWDVDNDGWLDLFVSGYGLANQAGSNTDLLSDYLGFPALASRLRLYRNRGDGTFDDVSTSFGIDRVAFAMGANYGDLDNDGWLDLYLGTGEPDLRALHPNLMFRNARGRGFHDVTTSGGFGHLQKGHGIAFGDIDHDGDQDIYAVMGGAYSGDVFPNALFENPGHGNRWLTLELEGADSNRDAVGARIRVRVGAGDGARDIHRVVGTGGSFGASPLRQEIGLGLVDGTATVEIVWPTGRSQLIENLAIDSAWRLREGETEPQALSYTSFSLPEAGGVHHHPPAGAGANDTP